MRACSLIQIVAVALVFRSGISKKMEVDATGSLSEFDGYDISDPGADHTEHAIMLDENGDMKGAVASFRAATVFDPQEPTAWFNFATALHDENNPDREEDLWEARKVRFASARCGWLEVCK
jgi:hypothetical protein